MILGFQWFKASWEATKAFLKAYDHVSMKSPLGFPILRGWSKGESIYDQLFSDIADVKSENARAGFVFSTGRSNGSFVYLPTGISTVGSGCHNDVVITTPVMNEKNFRVEVGDTEAIISASHMDAPVFINGHRIERAVVVDQDEISFNGARFYYLGLESL